MSVDDVSEKGYQWTQEIRQMFCFSILLFHLLWGHYTILHLPSIPKFNHTHHTVDNPAPVEKRSFLSHYLKGFNHPFGGAGFRWPIDGIPRVLLWKITMSNE